MTAQDKNWQALQKLGPLKGQDEEFNPALRDVLLERVSQEGKWGEQNHDPFTYLAILQEEVGEFAKEAVAERFTGDQNPNLRAEAVQVAAVALAIVECLDRKSWSWPKSGKETA